MSDLNRVCLTGRLTRDPELRTLPSGNSVGSMRVAINGYAGDGSDRVDYIDLSVFGAQAEACTRILHKGSRVSVDGRLSYREWTAKDDSTRSKHEVVAQHVGFLDSRPANSKDETQETDTDEQAADQASSESDTDNGNDKAKATTPRRNTRRSTKAKAESAPEPVGVGAASGDDETPL